MRWPALLAGTLIAMAAGWGAGRCWPQGKAPPEPPPAVDREAAAAMVLPEKLDTYEARTWAAGLELPVLRGLIERLATAPGSAAQYEASQLLFGVFFERDGTGAADQWLKIEPDCHLPIDRNLARWAGREPEAAAAWLSSHFEELYRYRSGELIVDVSREIMAGCAGKNPALAVRWLMEKPEFFDREPLGALTGILDKNRDRDRLLLVATWVREKSDDPRHALATLSGSPLDAKGHTVSRLGNLDAPAALAILAQVPNGDPRRAAWVEQLKHLPGAPTE